MDQKGAQKIRNTRTDFKDAQAEVMLRSMIFQLLWENILSKGKGLRGLAGSAKPGKSAYNTGAVESVRLLVLPKERVLGRISRYLRTFLVRHSSFQPKKNVSQDGDTHVFWGVGDDERCAAQYDMSMEVLSTITSVRVALFLPPM